MISAAGCKAVTGNPVRMFVRTVKQRRRRDGVTVLGGNYIGVTNDKRKKGYSNLC